MFYVWQYFCKVQVNFTFCSSYQRTGYLVRRRNSGTGFYLTGCVITRHPRANHELIYILTDMSTRRPFLLTPTEDNVTKPALGVLENVKL